MDGIFNFLLGVSSFVIVLSIVVFVHEFGHFQVAKWLGVKIDAFSIGFGKELLAWTDKTGVRWRIGALPLGGYVKFTGDKDASSFPDDIHDGATKEGNFHLKPVWVRAAVAFAGPFFNFLFSVIVFAIFFLAFGESVQKPIVREVMPNSAAMAAGVRVGDEFLSIDGSKLKSSDDMSARVATSGGQKLDFAIKRGEQTVNLLIVPQVVKRQTPFGDTQSHGVIGVYLGGSKADMIYLRYNPITALGRGAQKCGEIITMQWNFIGALLRGAMSAGYVSGPLGIGQTAGMIAKSSIDGAGENAGFLAKTYSVSLALIQLASVLSIAIGFMNLLPLPILDGGHLVFYAIEAIRGKPVPEKIQAASFRIGFAALMMLFVFATIQDLARLGVFGPHKTDSAPR